MSNEQQRLEGGEVLNGVYEFLGRFVAYPSEEARVAHTLWIAHAHLMDVWENTPRIAFLSPEPASGKTRALEITELLVPRPVQPFNATPAYLFRKVSNEDGLPTILFDEIDTVFGDKSKKDNEELRGLFNAGHRRGATAGRCVSRGGNIETEDFPAYCAVAMAGLGHLPDTILTRSVIVRMRKRKKDEKVEAYRRRVHEPEGNALRDKLAHWASSIGERIAYPELPDEVNDRDADVWESLVAVADAVGRDWPERARAAAVALVALSRRDGGGSLGNRLLSDLRIVFRDEDKLFTSTIITRLEQLEEAPWNNIKGESISDRLLANLLHQYDIKSKDIRIGGVVKKGYEKRDLHDAWERYLAPLPSPFVTAQQGLQGQQDCTPLPSPPGRATGATSATAEKPSFEEWYNKQPKGNWRDHTEADNERALAELNRPRPRILF